MFFLYLNLVVTVNTSITNLLSLCFSFDSIKWSMSVLLPVHQVFLYLLRLLFCTKALPYWLHLYDLYPECILMWLISWLFSKITLQHWEHSYGLSPVCALTCPKRLQLVAKLLSHWWHLYAFFSVCILLWFMKPYSVRKSYHTRCIDKIYLFYGLVFGSHVMQFIIHHITIFKIATIIKTISALFLWSIIINLWSPLLYTF